MSEGTTRPRAYIDDLSSQIENASQALRTLQNTSKENHDLKVRITELEREVDNYKFALDETVISLKERKSDNARFQKQLDAIRDEARKIKAIDENDMNYFNKASHLIYKLADMKAGK